MMGRKKKQGRQFLVLQNASAYSCLASFEQRVRLKAWSTRRSLRTRSHRCALNGFVNENKQQQSIVTFRQSKKGVGVGLSWTYKSYAETGFN